MLQTFKRRIPYNKVSSTRLSKIKWRKFKRVLKKAKRTDFPQEIVENIVARIKKSDL